MTAAIRTFKEQKAYERSVRKAWLQSLAELGMTAHAAANLVGIDRAGLGRMAVNLGVNFPSVNEVGKARRSTPILTRQMMLDAQAAGMTARNVADAYGVSITCVYSARKREGVTLARGYSCVTKTPPPPPSKPPAPKPPTPLEMMKADAAAANRRMKARGFT